MSKDKKECQYCRKEKRADINSKGDNFALLHEPNEKWHLCAKGRNTFLFIEVRYCPICGRRLKKKERTAEWSTMR